MKVTRYDTMVTSKVVDVTESKKHTTGKNAVADAVDLPFLSKDESNYDTYVKRIKHYKTSNPALYFKLLNWD